MISYIKGEVTDLDEEGLVIENNGMGYQLAASVQSMSHFRVGESYKIYTVQVVREDDISLYGFYEEEERTLFLLLNRVSTIGPKVALSILSALTVDAVIGAILNNDPKALARAPGVGAKTASRIILELVDRVKKLGYQVRPEEARPSADPGDSQNYQVAIQALLNLGYARNEAEHALRDWNPEEALEEGIRHALRRLS